MVSKTASDALSDIPVKWCVVTLSEVLSAGKRIDATMFDMELKAARSALAESPYEKGMLVGKNGLCTAYRPGICKRIFVEKSDKSIGMLTPSQVTDVAPKIEKYLSVRMQEQISNWFVQRGEILLTCSGTIGKVSLVTDTLYNKCVSQNLIRIVPKENDDAGYVYAFLKSKIGQLFLTRNNYGAVIQHIDPEHLTKIPIPVAPKALRNRIHELIDQSYSLRDESNRLLDEATKILTESLKLPAMEELQGIHHPEALQTFSIKLSQMEGRADASYHVPIVSSIINHLNKYAGRVAVIGEKDISKAILLPGRFKRIYVDEGYGITFFSGKNISELDPTDKRYLSFSQHDRKIKDELLIRENMILVTCSGTIGNTVLVPKHWDGWAMTHDIIRLILKDDIQGYCFVWLNSEYGRTILQSLQYGSVVQHIEKEHISRMPIPLLQDKKAQRKINDLALEANRKRYDAYLLEQQAIEIMNDEVIYVK